MAKKKEPVKFKVGDRVKWGSGAGHGWTEKIGVVLLVVEPRVHPGEFIANKVKAGTHLTKYGGGLGRDHESYVVEVSVGKTGKAKKVLYWPRVSAMEAVKTRAKKQTAPSGPAYAPEE